MEEMTFQDILREKQRMEYKYKGKAYKEYHKLKAWEKRIYVICLTVFFIVFFAILFIESLFLMSITVIVFFIIWMYVFNKILNKFNSKLSKTQNDAIKKLNKKIYKKMKKKYNVKAYPDHICFNGNIYVHPNNWRCYIYDENNQNFYAFFYHYKEGKTEISNRYTITGEDFLDIWQHRHEWIMINNEKGEGIIDDGN